MILWLLPLLTLTPFYSVLDLFKEFDKDNLLILVYSYYYYCIWINLLEIASESDYISFS